VTCRDGRMCYGAPPMRPNPFVPESPLDFSPLVPREVDPKTFDPMKIDAPPPDAPDAELEALRLSMKLDPRRRERVLALSSSEFDVVVALSKLNEHAFRRVVEYLKSRSTP
jgi:hypothetical protein